MRNEIRARIGFKTTVPLSSRPRSNRGQMDGADHPGPREWNTALRRAAKRDRWNLSEDAHANTAQSGARRPGLAQGSSDRAAQSGILAHPSWPHPYRPAARALPMVGAAFARAAGESNARHRTDTGWVGGSSAPPLEDKQTAAEPIILRTARWSA